MTQSTTSLLLRLSAVLWIIWGIVHVMAGFIIIPNETAAAVSAIADAVDPSLLTGPYHAAVGAVLNQHGFNLMWIGAFTVVGGLYIWRQSVTAVFFTAVVGGLTDVGYFVFMDLGGYVRFLPGTLMTIFSATAIVLSAVAYRFGLRDRSTG